MVSLLARTITLYVEGKMMENRMRATLDQAASMMVARSQFSLENPSNFHMYFEVADPFLFAGCHGGGLSPARLFGTT